LVSSNVYEMLLKQGGEIVIPSYQGANGHPVLFQTKIIKDLFTVSNKYANLREFIASQNHYIVEVADPGVVMDIDTREDYWRAVRYFYFNQ
jgi:molybdenum cofactor cytidylyltransferase